MSSQNISSVTYKKGSLMRYGLWAIVIVLLVTLAVIAVRTIKNELSSVIPEGYSFSVADAQAGGNGTFTTYYVYPDSILMERITHSDDTTVRSGLIYDNIDTSSLVYEEDDTETICDSSDCYDVPKVVSSIKKLISGRVGREYGGS